MSFKCSSDLSSLMRIAIRMLTFSKFLRGCASENQNISYFFDVGDKC